MRKREIENQPKVRKPLDTTKSLFAGVFGQKDKLRCQRGCPSALAGDAKFFFEIAMNVRDRFYEKGLLHSSNIISLFPSFVKAGKNLFAGWEKFLIFFNFYIII